MISRKKNKFSKSSILAGFFLFTSCLGASVAQSTEQAPSPGKDLPPPAQSQGPSPFSGLFLLEAGYTYTHWNPEKISGTEVETQGLNLAWIELQSQTIGGLSKYFSIPRMRFETSLTENNFSDEEVIYSHHEMNEYYHYFVGMVQAFFPIAFRYETERFVSKLSSETDLYYAPNSGENYQRFQKGDTLYHETVFHDYSLLYKVNRGSYSLAKNADIFIGLSYSEYQKPYNIDESLNRELYNDIKTDYIFYSRFKGYGLLIERITPLDKRGARLDFSLKIGYGEVELTDKYKMSDLIRSYGDREDYQNIIYLNPKVEIGYREFFGTSKHIVFDAFLSGDYRGFSVHDSDDTGDINEDLLLKAYVSLGIIF
ncbi:MAG: hypothetical protein Q3M24_07965 [Candidatus Electrothrix aestuarii]|uniref:DUF3570 domain-containing protein n=1 Tax=Candidatus Electrothrix aestuarii TaxID=3062594 RepID=A0AAU8LYN7_9BACT|nr:hypothetical protein [Candidatus Electrothrix aestuarii]